jgi:hypothetical protein
MNTEVVVATVDLGPLIRDVLLPFLGVVLTVIAGWAGKKFAEWMGVKRDDALAAKIEEAMKNGLALAQSRLEQKIGTGPINVETKSELVATAGKYATDHVPGALKALGVTPEVLQEKLEARLGLNTTPPEQSIAVPTPPASTEVKPAADR